MLALPGGSVAREVEDVPLLLVSSDRSGDEALYAASTDGRALQRLTNGFAVAVAPDGRRLVVSDEGRLVMLRAEGGARQRLPGDDAAGGAAFTPDGSAFAYGDLDDTLRVVDTSGRVTVTVADASQPTWAPDGRKVAFVAFGTGRLMRAAVGGVSEKTLIAEPGLSVGDVAASPTGDALAFSLRRTRDDGWHVYTAAPDGTKAVQLTRAAGDEDEPTWSPDGREIAYVRERDDGTTEIWVMARDGSGPRRLTRGHADDHPVWSPDGKTIAFDRDKERLYAVGPAGEGVRALGSARATHPSWSPDGSRLLATTNLGRGLLAVVEFNSAGRLLRTLTGGNRDEAPVYSPEAAKIAFVRNGQLAVINADGTGVELLTSAEETAVEPDWSRLGLLYATWPHPLAADLDVLDLATGTRTTIARDAYFLSSPAWSPNGRSLAYWDPDEHARLVDLASGVGTTADVDGGRQAAWSPDGTLLAASHKGGLRVVDTTGRVVLEVAGGEDWAWNRDGRIAYVRDRYAIEVADARSGKTETLVPAQRRRRISSLAWSGDGSSLAFRRERIEALQRDVFVVDAAGREQRVTQPFPDGGNNEVAAWLLAPRPPAAPAPRHVADVVPHAVKRANAVLRLHQGAPVRVYSTAAPSAGCGLLFVGAATPRRGAIEPCVRDHALLAAAATTHAVAWILDHVDEGIGDEDGACLYLLPLTGRPLKGRLPDCYGGRGVRARGQVDSVFGGTMGPLLAAGDDFVAQTSWYDLETGGYISRFHDGRRQLVVRPNKKVSVALLDADASRVLVRRGREVLVMRANGSVWRRLAFPRRSVLGGALGGRRLVILRRNAIEQYDIATRRRLARLALTRGFGPPPELVGASGAVAAYVEGAALHLVRFTDRRDVALRIAGLVPPLTAALTSTSLTLAYQRENADAFGTLATVRVADLLR